MAKKILNLNIYKLKNIKHVEYLFSNYVNINIEQIDSKNIKIAFTGDNCDIYLKEFLNYLIIAESKGV